MGRLLFVQKFKRNRALAPVQRAQAALFFAAITGLRAELEIAMALSGCTNLQTVDKALVYKDS